MSDQPAFIPPLATALELEAEPGVETAPGRRAANSGSIRRRLMAGASTGYVLPRQATLLSGVDDDVLFDDGGAK